MRKLSIIVSLLALSVLFTGCGGPKVPADTVVAVYVDVPQAVENIADFYEVVLDQMPSEVRSKAVDWLGDNKNQIEEKLKTLDMDWLVFMICADENKGKSERCAVVLKCDYNAGVSYLNGRSLKEFVAEHSGKTGKLKGEKVYHWKGFLIAFVDDEYVLMTQYRNYRRMYYEYSSRDDYDNADYKDDRSEEIMRNLIAIYRDDEGDVSEDFDDLDDIDGDAVARVQTAKMATLAKLTGLKCVIDEIATQSGDEKLSELILEIGNISLDFLLSEDEVGLKLEVDAGSREIGKLVESALNLGAFCNRIMIDWGVFMAKCELEEVKKRQNRRNSRRNRHSYDDWDSDEYYYTPSLLFGPFWQFDGAFDFVEGSDIEELGELLRKAPDVSRWWSTVSAEYVVDAEDGAALIVPIFGKMAEKFVERLSAEDVDVHMSRVLR